MLSKIIFCVICLGSSQQYLSAQENSKNLPLLKNYEQYIITAPPSALQLDTFYKKYVDAYGIPVVSSEKVPNAGLLVARDIINYMLLKRPDLREQLVTNRARLCIMAQTEMETDLPERSDWKKPTIDDGRLKPSEIESYNKPGGIASMTDKQYWNQRARGMGGTITSCAEENILGYPGTKYFGENILVHEFSHNIMEAILTADIALYKDIEAAYQHAKSKGLFKNQYAINTKEEYWAEGTQWWFWSNIEFYDGKARVQSPDDLKSYDRILYNLLDRVYIGHHIPTDVYYSKNLSNALK